MKLIFSGFSWTLQTAWEEMSISFILSSSYLLPILLFPISFVMFRTSRYFLFVSLRISRILSWFILRKGLSYLSVFIIKMWQQLLPWDYSTIFSAWGGAFSIWSYSRSFSILLRLSLSVVLNLLLCLSLKPLLVINSINLVASSFPSFALSPT